MLAGRIALVSGKSVRREPRVPFFHDPIARDLGDDAGRGDTQADGVTFYQGGMRNGERLHRQAIDECMVRPDG